MASKGPRSKLDHETRAKRQKALEAPREPRRPKTHWDHVIEEMVWLSKDFESERKWKLSQAKKVALKASKGTVDHVTRGEKRVKEEEQRLRKVALNISKDVKKFWMKIEKLVLYKHQMVLDEKKKKALDKQLEFLLGQTERYSTMLAENLVDPYKAVQPYSTREQLSIQHNEGNENDVEESEKVNTQIDIDDRATLNDESQLGTVDIDGDYGVLSEDEVDDGDFVFGTGEEKDDETTLLDEEELAKAELNDPIDEISLLQKESEIPIEELLARYKKDFDSDEAADDESDHEMGAEIKSEGRESENRVIADAAAAARSAQPTGNTFSTTQVRTKFPFLIKHPLREYQHIGLDWLVTMYEKRLNGILADEMGLGKTIMTIALLAHLACEKGIWGPHLIVVPTSVMLNWETEFLKWCPAFKILTYFGSAKERKLKRQGWMKQNYFHVCITTYRLVIQDSKVFKRKKWKYLILDEAHLIKNWKSQRWQTLLNFNSKRRILLTGTPLQNDLMELWSLMHFLMPHIFQSHQEFKDWFCNPISGMVDGQEKVNKEVVDRLHNVLRPFILRRLKRDVEKQLPLKYEHVIYCRLSKRQRNLYEDFIASSETQATLASANFFGMISVIMQLRKVCNHPDLFEGRPIVSSFDMIGIASQLSSSVCSIFSSGPFSGVDLVDLGFVFTHLDFRMTSWESDEVMAIETPSSLIEELPETYNREAIGLGLMNRKKSHGTNIFADIRKAILEERLREAKERAASIAWWNSLRCRKKPIYSTTLREIVTIRHPVYEKASNLGHIVLSPVERFHQMIGLVESFMFAIPAARAPPPFCWCSKTGSSVFLNPTYIEKCSDTVLPLLSSIRPAIVRRQVYFPDRRLIQFDCGKLQELAILLRRLKSEGHRALIFTQMTKMLDILEAFINLYGYTYMRLDGSTQPEERQTLMQRFNTNPKYFLFILSTRSGGVGINLVGADTVIFYDSDWNPAMDQQAQDRCHRIGQTREVHIFRFISESTIEENILKKANQKRALDNLVIQSGGYNTEFFKKLDPMELFSGTQNETTQSNVGSQTVVPGEVDLSNADVEAALKYAEDEADYMALKRVEQEEEVDNQEFTEETIGRLEDDELGNEDDVKVDEITTVNKDSGVILNETEPNDERALTLVSNDDDVDMLADVRQMAAAAAASGEAISTFENQLRPIDRYAIRFLELWDPIINKAVVESQETFQETEWELDRIEKLKEDLEAENDDDEEPLVYERWDADFATEAYRQQVEEALAQHQLMEELESEAKEKEDAANAEIQATLKNGSSSDRKSKSKKKQKKGKFKSLKKKSMSSELKTINEDDLETEPMTVDEEEIIYSDVPLSPPSTSQKKRKRTEVAEDEGEESSMTKKKSKKPKKPPQEAIPLVSDPNEFKELKSHETVAVDIEKKQPASKSKVGGKVSITFMPVKRVLMIKPEKLKKKGNIWSRDCFPSPDSWLPQEDAVLCAVVHEYGPHWSLVSETLYGMTAGGSYRGRYRHPIHCCERFRELIQRYVLSVAEHFHSEKVNNAGSGKALLKVTEENIRMLLAVAAEMPDCEFLIEKHFTALLSSVWRTTARRQFLSRSQNGFYTGGNVSASSFGQQNISVSRKPQQRMHWLNYGHNANLLSAALRDVNSKPQNDKGFLFNLREEAPVFPEELGLTLEYELEQGPAVVNVTIYGGDPQLPFKKPTQEDSFLKSSQEKAEDRLRSASTACGEGFLGWASSVFPTNNVKSRSPLSKVPILGKHKLSFTDPTKPNPKSKFKKTLMEPIEMNHPIPLTVTPNEPILNFDLVPPVSPDFRPETNFEVDFPSLENYFSWETNDREGLTHHTYDPGFILELDDFPSMPEINFL